MFSIEMTSVKSFVALLSSPNISTSIASETVENNVITCNSINVNQTIPSEKNGNSNADTQLVNYVCGICLADFSDKSHFHDHCASHMDIKPDVCETCHKIFTSKNEMEDHLCTASIFKLHQTKTVLDVSETSKFSNAHSDTNRINKDKSTKHFSSCNYDKLKAGVSFKENVSTKFNAADGNKFKCKICNEMLSSRSSLCKNCQRHFKKTQHYCSICDEMF